MAESGVKPNHFSLNRGIISVWVVTCRRCCISLNCLSPSWRAQAHGRYRETLAVLLTKRLPFFLAAGLAVVTTSNVVQRFHQHHWASHLLRAGKNTLAHIYWPDYAFLLCLPVVGHILLCSQDAAGKPSKSWVGTCSRCKGTSSIPCNNPGLVSQNIWCYPELCKHFEQSLEGWNQLLVRLAKWTGTVMQAVPFFLLQTRHRTGVQHSSLCSLAEPAALLSTPQKQNFIICFNFNGFLEGSGMVFCFFCFSFYFGLQCTPCPGLCPAPISEAAAWGKRELRYRWKKFPLVKQR